MPRVVGWFRKGKSAWIETGTRGVFWLIHTMDRTGRVTWKGTQVARDRASAARMAKKFVGWGG